MRDVRKALGRAPLAHIHWRTLKHHDKVFYAQVLAKLPARLIAVCVHKPSIRDRTTFQQKDVLYFYAVRYLLERVSWLARDAAVAGEGDGRARLVFSERTHMSYIDLFTYLDLLKRRQKAGVDVRIAFPALCIERDKIKVIQSYKQAGLQLVDAWVGAVWNGLEQESTATGKLAMPEFCHRCSIDIVELRSHTASRSSPTKLLPSWTGKLRLASLRHGGGKTEHRPRAVEFGDHSLPPIKTANGSPRACLCPTMLRLRDAEVNWQVFAPGDRCQNGD